VTLDNIQTAKSTKPNANPIPRLQETHDAWHSAQAATEQAQNAFDQAVVEARIAIAALDEPWTVSGIVRLVKEDTKQSAPPPPPVGNIKCRGPIGGRVAPSETVITGRIFLGQVCLDPFYVAKERFGGEERRVVVYPTARSESEALALASQECQAAAEAWAEAVAAIVERCAVHVANDALWDAKEAEGQAHYRVEHWPQ
jgi:hypothetical protein